MNQPAVAIVYQIVVENKDIFPLRLVSACVVPLCSVAFPAAIWTRASGKQPTNANGC
jgi:hypothetical protein